MIIIHAVFKVRPEAQEKFLEEVKPLIAASREEEGNLSYGLYQHTGADHEFMMIEEWRDGEAVASHNASAHFTGFAAKAGDFLSAPLEAKVYNGEQINK